MRGILGIVGGITGAVVLSQYPEFSQQYLQRLAGRVDALGAVVADFDASAKASGLSRYAALAELQGTPFLLARQADMTRTFATHARLVDDLTLLRAARPLERLMMPHRLADADTFTATWTDFRPAVPVTMVGGVSAGVGYLMGWGLISVLLSALAWPFRRRVA